MNGLDDTVVQAQQFWAAYGQPIIFGVGGLAILIAAVLGWRFMRTGKPHERVGTLAVVLATAFSADGMWAVARKSLHLSVPVALVLFAMFEVVMLSQALLAKHKLTVDAKANITRHINFVWTLAGLSGAVACLNSANPAEVVLRLVAPSVAAAIWWMNLTADGVARQPDAITWRITPRRILVRLGIVEPGSRDVIQVDRERRIAAMTVTAHRLHHGSWFPGMRASKLRRLALAADDDMVTEVQRRVQRVHRIETLTKPGAAVATAATSAPESATATAPAPATDGATTSLHLSSTMYALDPQLAEVVRNGRGGSARNGAARNGKNAQVSTAATDRSDEFYMTIAGPLVARSLAATGAAPSQRSVRNEIEKHVQPAPGFKKVGELIERATAAHRERSERPATDDSERSDDPDRERINGHSHDLIGAAS